MCVLSLTLCVRVQSLMNHFRPKDTAMIAKWRREASSSGRHSHIADEIDRMVDPEVARELRGIDLQPMTKVELVELSKIIGLPHSGTKQAILDRLAPVIASINGK